MFRKIPPIQSLVESVKNNDLQSVLLYMKKGGNLIQPLPNDPLHPSLLFYASSAQMVRMLLSAPQLDSIMHQFKYMKNELGNTALHHAFTENAPQPLILSLISHQVGIGEVNNQGLTAILLAIKQKYATAASWLISKDDLNKSDSEGNSIMHLMYAWKKDVIDTQPCSSDASYVSITELERMMIQMEYYGAPTFSLNNKHQTPTQYALDLSRKNNFPCLLEHQNPPCLSAQLNDRANQHT